MLGWFKKKDKEKPKSVPVEESVAVENVPPRPLPLGFLHHTSIVEGLNPHALATE